VSERRGMVQLFSTAFLVRNKLRLRSSDYGLAFPFDSVVAAETRQASM
jgi:hypothetical protein